MSDDAEQVARLRIQATDETGPALRSISENLERTKKTFETLGAGLVLGKVFRDFASFQRTLEQVQFSVGATDKQMLRLKQTLVELSRSTGVSVEQLGQQFDAFQNLSGQATDTAAEQFKTITLASKITGASIEGLGRTAAGAINDMKVSAGDISDLVSRWAVEMPTTILNTFSRVGPRLMQSMQAIGLTGKKNAEELGVAFSEVAKATGSPRTALRSMNSLLEAMGTSSSKFGRMMIPTLQRVQEHGGTLFDELNAVYGQLNKLGAFKPKNRPWLEELTGLTFQQVKAIQTLHDKQEAMNAAIAKGGTAATKMLEQQAKFAGDAKSALDDLTESAEGLGRGLAALASNVGFNRLIHGIAAGVEGAADTMGAIGRRVTNTQNDEDKEPGTVGSRTRTLLVGAGEVLGSAAAGVGTTLLTKNPKLGWMAGVAGFGAGRMGAEKLGDILGLPQDESEIAKSVREDAAKGIEHHSRGGIITKPTLSTLAEDGPEAVIPLTGPGSGGGKSSTEATKELTLTLARLINVLQDDNGRGRKLAFTPGAGEAGTPATAQVYGSGGGSGSGGSYSVGGSGGGGGKLASMAAHPFGGGGGSSRGSVGGGGPGLDGHQAPVSGSLAAQRAGFIKELESDPHLRDFAIDAMAHEGEIQSNMEQLFNYASMHHMTIRQALHSGQYGPVIHHLISGRISAKRRALGIAAIAKVGAGSNITDYATDQGMAGDPNFAKYMANRSYYNMHKVNGAWFSYHGERGRKWAERERAADRAAATHQDASVFSHGTSAIPHLQHQSMLQNHRAMRAEMERPIKMTIHTPNMAGRRQRMQKLQASMYGEDMIGVPRYASQLDIGLA